jgi:very-short-patch-repair endonuclease
MLRPAKDGAREERNGVSDKRLTGTARRLRSNMTDAELRLWSHLRGRQLAGEKFVRQFPIGRAIADFACRSGRLVIEVDGGQHAGSVGDVERTAMIEAHGYHVIRFWNNDVLTNTEGVLETIHRELLIARNRTE